MQDCRDVQKMKGWNEQTLYLNAQFALGGQARSAYKANKKPIEQNLTALGRFLTKMCSTRSPISGAHKRSNEYETRDVRNYSDRFSNDAAELE